MNEIMTDDELDRQLLIADIIDEAISCNYEITKGHGNETCNCFQEKFVSSLIEKNIFIGFNKLASVCKKHMEEINE